MWPLGRGHFWPQGHYLNNFGRDPLADAPCKISKLWGLWFQRRRFFNIVPMCISIEIMWPLGQGHFWPHIHYLNNFGRDPLDDAPCKISELWGLWFQRRRFLNISLHISIGIMWPLGRGQYWPRAMTWTNLVEDHYTILHTKYESSRHNGSGEEDFQSFSYTTPFKTADPQGQSQYWTQGHDLNKFGRGTIDNITYQIWKLWV